jgi:hypothetical protein
MYVQRKSTTGSGPPLLQTSKGPSSTKHEHKKTRPRKQSQCEASTRTGRYMGGRVPSCIRRQLIDHEPRNSQSQSQHGDHGENHKQDQIPMRFLRRRLHPWPHGTLDVAARGLCKPLKVEELFVTFLVESDDGRSTVVGVDHWTLARLRWGGDEGRVVEFAPHFDLEESHKLGGVGAPVVNRVCGLT